MASFSGRWTRSKNYSIIRVQQLQGTDGIVKVCLRNMDVMVSPKGRRSGQAPQQTSLNDMSLTTEVPGFSHPGRAQDPDIGGQSTYDPKLRTDWIPAKAHP